MKKLIIPATVSLALFSFTSNASSIDGPGFFAGTEVQVSTTDDTFNNENLVASGVGINLGYYFNRYVGLGASYSINDDLVFNESFEHYDFMVLGRLPVSDKFSVLFGGGTAVYNNETLPKGKIGLSYQVNDNFSWDAGYSFYGEPDDWEEPIQSFNFGFTYYFGQEKQVKVLPLPAPVEPKPTPKPQPIPQPVIEKKPVCKTMLVNDTYEVKPGEWLRKIAYNHNMSWGYFKKENSEFISGLKSINIIQPGDVIKINLSKEICK